MDASLWPGMRPMTPRPSSSLRMCSIYCFAGNSAGWPKSIGRSPVTAIEPVGMRETYDSAVEEDHNFIANDLVVHNSHAASFALLAYASTYLKAHHPAAFYAALLNNQPMGFYHPATIVRRRPAARAGDPPHRRELARAGSAPSSRTARCGSDCAT